MYNELVNKKICQGWDVLLAEAKRLLAEEKDPARRRELRFAVRGFSTLRKRRALLPGMWRELKRKARTDRESVPA